MDVEIRALHGRFCCASISQNPSRQQEDDVSVFCPICSVVQYVCVQAIIIHRRQMLSRHFLTQISIFFKPAIKEEVTISIILFLNLQNKSPAMIPRFPGHDIYLYIRRSVTDLRLHFVYMNKENATCCKNVYPEQ